jgi:hypothetical protein
MKNCIIFILSCILTTHLNAQNDSYLNKMPSAEKILAETKGTDELDTKAKQSATCSILQDVITTIVSKTRNWQFTPREQQYNAMYSSASSKIIADIYTQLDPSGKLRFNEGSPAYNWKQREELYKRDNTFLADILNKYVPSEQQKTYISLRNKRMEEIAEYEASPDYKNMIKSQEAQKEELVMENLKEIEKDDKLKWDAIYYILFFLLKK